MSTDSKTSLSNGSTDSDASSLIDEAKWVRRVFEQETEWQFEFGCSLKDIDGKSLVLPIRMAIRIDMVLFGPLDRSDTCHPGHVHCHFEFSDDRDRSSCHSHCITPLSLRSYLAIQHLGSDPSAITQPLLISKLYTVFVLDIDNAYSTQDSASSVQRRCDGRGTRARGWTCHGDT